jgi:hypothetical protein
LLDSCNGYDAGGASVGFVGGCARPHSGSGGSQGRGGGGGGRYQQHCTNPKNGKNADLVIPIDEEALSSDFDFDSANAMFDKGVCMYGLRKKNQIRKIVYLYLLGILS